MVSRFAQGLKICTGSQDVHCIAAMVETNNNLWVCLNSKKTKWILCEFIESRSKTVKIAALLEKTIKNTNRIDTKLDKKVIESKENILTLT